MTTIADIEQRVQFRLEEQADDIGTFWSVQNEIRPTIVEAMNEATLITGEPQVRAKVTFTIPASTVFTPLVMPTDAIALLRVEGPGGLPTKKCWIWDLDKQFPGWETMTGDTPRYWVPFGLSQFLIFPCLTAPVQVVLNYVQVPVNVAPPYTGTEVIPFQSEYIEGFEDYAAHILRLKEGNPDFAQSVPEYQKFLSAMEELSSFAYRKNSLRFTRTGGAQSAINEKRGN
jgi:hypothetical protein